MEYVNSINVRDKAGDVRPAHLRWGGNPAAGELYKLENGPMLFMSTDGTLRDADGNLYSKVR